MRLTVIIREARACRVCAASLPHQPRPLLQGSARSRILIIGQAPGAAAHTSGIPWDDRSGERLRAWLGLTPTQFYNDERVALMPMGFCYPGHGPSGDRPPRPECAPLWHPRLLPALNRVELVVYIGKYAFARYLSQDFDSITDAVAGWKRLLPNSIALPHPSPRNNIWLKKHAWFERKTIPALKERVVGLFRQK